MPFGPQREPQKQESKPSNPLFKVTGLWPWKSGLGLSGSLKPNYITREGNESSGEQLIALITQAMEENKEVRFMVFDNQLRHGAKMPYQLVCTISEPYQRPEQTARDGQPERGTDETAPDTSAPIQLPPPSRRTAPRR